MSLDGIEDGVGGLGSMNERGVLGGSMLGTSFFHASTNAASAACSAGRSAEKRRVEALIAEEVRMGRWRSFAACRNMAEEGRSSLGSRKVGEAEAAEDDEEARFAGGKRERMRV